MATLMAAEEFYVLTSEDAERLALHGPITNGATPEPPKDSWTPINLNSLPDQPPIQPTLGGVGIVYPGKRHVFSGPPESAKTLCAYVIGLNVVRHGGQLILIDFEMGGYDARSRLTELGASRDDLDRIHYLEPDQRATDDRIRTLTALHPQLVIVDAAAGAYNLEGLDDNKRGDVEKLARLYVTAFWRAGIATLFIDHVVKNTENRGAFQIGSERKLGGADVHLGFETVRAISRGTTGLYKILTHKDRGGYLKRGRLADLELESDPETYQIAWTLKTPDTATDEHGHHRPTKLMEKVSRHLELQHEPVTRSSIVETLGSNKQWVLHAITALVTEGFAGETDGPKRSKLVTRINVYREDDPDCNPEKAASGSVVLCSSEWFSEPQLVSGSVVPPPVGGNTRNLSTRGTQKPFSGSDPHEGSWLDDLAATVDLDRPADPPEPEGAR